MIILINEQFLALHLKDLSDELLKLCLELEALLDVLRCFLIRCKRILLVVQLLLVFDYLSAFPKVLNQDDLLVDLHVKMILWVAFLLELVYVLPGDLF